MWESKWAPHLWKFISLKRWKVLHNKHQVQMCNATKGIKKLICWWHWRVLVAILSNDGSWDWERQKKKRKSVKDPPQGQALRAILQCAYSIIWRQEPFWIIISPKTPIMWHFSLFLTSKPNSRRFFYTTVSLNFLIVHHVVQVSFKACWSAMYLF